jgi:hypothetical protein
MTFTITRPGIYTDVPTDDYYADPIAAGPSFTQSLAKIVIERSVAHAKAEHPRMAPVEAEDDTPERYDAAKAIGNAAHALLIGRGKEIAVGEFNAWQSKDAKTFKADAWVAGKTAILSKHMARAEAMSLAARYQIDAVGWTDVFREGHGEVVIAWEEDGLWFRSLIDWMVDPSRVYDLKTSAMSVAPHAIPKLMTDADWPLQAAFHERGLDVLDPGGAGRRKHRFIAQENEPPYALTPVELTEAVMTMGRKRLDFAIKRWRHAMETGEFLAYPAEVCRPEYPGWRETQWLGREVEESERKPKLTSLMGG